MKLAGVTFALFVGAAFASSRLEVIELPEGFQPEGIVFAEDWTAYVSSIGHGAIWKGDMRTGEGEVVVPPVGAMSLGLDYDKRTGYLYVAGGFNGTLRVYDEDYNLVFDQVMDPYAPISFINSVVIADDYVYATDSFRSQFYALPLGDDHKPMDGSDTVVEIVRISGDGFPSDVDVFVDYSQSIKSNGIVLSDDETMMVICIMSTSELYLVDAETGEAKRINLQGVLVSGDGLLRRGNTLWLVENGVVRSGVYGLHEVVLSEDWTCGKVTRFYESDLLDAPTTAARKSNGIYTVNARLFVPAEEVATASYSVVRIDRDAAEAMC